MLWSSERRDFVTCGQDKIMGALRISSLWFALLRKQIRANIWRNATWTLMSHAISHPRFRCLSACRSKTDYGQMCSRCCVCLVFRRRVCLALRESQPVNKLAGFVYFWCWLKNCMVKLDVVSLSRFFPPRTPIQVPPKYLPMFIIAEVLESSFSSWRSEGEGCKSPRKAFLSA